MMKIKYSVLYIVGFFLSAAAAYYMCEKSLSLLWTDVLTCFADNRKGLCVITAGCFIFLIVMVLLHTSRIVLCWEIRIGRWSVELSDLREKKGFINAILVVSVVITALVCSNIAVSECEYRIDESWSGYNVTHAMGSVDGKEYTNSLEAFEENYVKGQRVFEVDFELTSDGKVVCKHDWSDWNEWPEIPTEAEYLSSKIMGEYTPLSLEECLLLLDEYEDIWLMTDSKYIETEQIATEFRAIMDVINKHDISDVLERLIVQVYDEDMYDQIKAVYDFPQVVFTMYKLEWEGETDEFERYCRFFRRNGIKYVTMSRGFVSEELIEIADRYGLRVYAHTVNDVKTAKEILEKGVYGIYTDEILMEQLREE